ncbi:MAG: chromate efflux transporter [Pseudomonadota bacterium]
MNDRPTFAEAFAVWSRIGVLSFGGPAAQIALMHREVVDRKSWLSEKQFLNALSFCMLLPGPEAMQLATFAGWRLHGLIGGLAAGLMFVLPGAIIVLCLAAAYVAFGDAPLMAAIFLGVKAAVVVIVIEALIKVAKRALKGADRWVMAGLAFAGIFFFQLPFPLIVLAAALYGFAKGGEAVEVAGAPSVSPKQTLMTVLIWAAIWAAPVLLIWIFGGAPLLLDVAGFFSKLAVVTFGGAYAVLAYMAQDVVSGFGWLTTGQMMDGLGLAETTPGPLILVTEFVGFLAGYQQGGWGLAILAAALTLWVTFAPCFLWIFAGAPYIDWLGAQPRLAGALAAITAAVVGVILNLSLWFAIHVFFAEVSFTALGPIALISPDPGSIDWRVAALTLISAALLLWVKWGVPRTLAIAAASGLALSYF